jgi:transcriptional regulator with XRE-family HTH domain
MSDEVTIGARLRTLRRWRGMTQAQVAGLAGLSQPFLSQVECGRSALDRRSSIAALAAALRVSETDITGGPHLSADPVQSDPHNAVPALRAALETNTLRRPTVDRARPLDELVQIMHHKITPLRTSCDYVELGEYLPQLLDELHLHVADPADEAAHRLALDTLIEACVGTASTVHNLGHYDLAHLAANRASEAAAITGDPVQQGKADFMRILTMPRGGSWDRMLIAAEHAADDLQPHVKQPLDMQVLGMITLIASLAAAVANNSDMADHWLGEAQALAARVPDTPVCNWELFSATNVRIWRVTVGVELGESGGTVLEKMEKVDQGKLTEVISRRSILLADTGRGLAREAETREEAVRWLRDAEDIAPQRIRNNAAVRHTLEVLREQALAKSVGVELRGMMARMGIPH